MVAAKDALIQGFAATLRAKDSAVKALGLQNQVLQTELSRVLLESHTMQGRECKMAGYEKSLQKLQKELTGQLAHAHVEIAALREENATANAQIGADTERVARLTREVGALRKQSLEREMPLLGLGDEFTDRSGVLPRGERSPAGSPESSPQKWTGGKDAGDMRRRRSGTLNPEL